MKKVSAQRAKARFFPRVHVLRTNTRHNTMYVAPVDGAAGGAQAARPGEARDELAAAAARAATRLGLGGIDVGALVSALPENRVQCYA